MFHFISILLFTLYTPPTCPAFPRHLPPFFWFGFFPPLLTPLSFPYSPHISLPSYLPDWRIETTFYILCLYIYFPTIPFYLILGRLPHVTSYIHTAFSFFFILSVYPFFCTPLLPSLHPIPPSIYPFPHLKLFLSISFKLTRVDHLHFWRLLFLGILLLYVFISSSDFPLSSPTVSVPLRILLAWYHLAGRRHCTRFVSRNQAMKHGEYVNENNICEGNIICSQLCFARLLNRYTLEAPVLAHPSPSGPLKLLCPSRKTKSPFLYYPTIFNRYVLSFLIWLLL